MTRNGRKSSVKDSFDHVTKLKWPLTRGKLSIGYTALILYSKRRTVTLGRLEEKKYTDVVFFLADFIVIFSPF